MTPAWYTATCVGEYVEGSAELPKLVQLVRLLDLQGGKDVCIHDQCGHLVAVVYADSGRAELLPRGGPLDPVQPVQWLCDACGAPSQEWTTLCKLCDAERTNGAPGVKPHGCEFCPRGSMGCAVCTGRGAA